jgi:hypothetical protein
MNRHETKLAAAITLMMATASCSDCGGLLDAPDGGLEASDDDVADVASETGFVCAAGPFGTPTPIAELNTDANESGFRASPNELVGLFVRLESTDASTYNDVYSTSRTTAGGPFDTPSVALMGDGPQFYAQRYPSLTSDTLSLFFESLCVDSNSVNIGPLCIATRQADSGLNDFVNYNDLQLTTYNGSFGAGFNVGDGFVTSDSLRYYVVGLETDDGGGPARTVDAGITNAIFITSRLPPSSTMPIDSFGPFTGSVFAPSDPTVLVDNPVLSSDELTMFVSTTSTTTTVPHIQSSTRATTGDRFGILTPSHELDSAEGEYPTWISPDQCRLYLTRTVGGQTDIYMATRSAQ